jgi:hypothetical protein
MKTGARVLNLDLDNLVLSVGKKLDPIAGP